MPNLDASLGLHEYALAIRAKRSELLASNLSNADTPHYKARDIDFKTLLNDYQQANQQTTPSNQMQTTRANHISTGSLEGASADPMYRQSLQPSIDGNTVDTQVEKAEYMQNAMRYQATLSFLDSRVRSLRKAIKGE